MAHDPASASSATSTALSRVQRRELPRGIDEAALLHTLFDANPDALLLVDEQGQILLCNPAAVALLGYAEPELVGMTVDALVPDSLRQRHAAYRATYAQARRARAMGTQAELVARRKDGSEVMVEIALNPLQIEGFGFVVAAMRDIGSYPRVKQALQRARYSEYLARCGRLAADSRDPRVLLPQVPAIAADALQVPVATVFLLGPDRQTFRVAAGVGAIEGEHIGAHVANRSDTPPGFVLAQGAAVVVRSYRGEQRFVVPQAYIAAGLNSALGVPLSDRGQPIGVLMVRSRERRNFGADELRFLESLSNLLATCLQRAQSEEALNHAQRLESVGQLTGGIAHDFNNLLTVIQGNLQVLDELPALAEDAHGQQLVGAAMRASRRGAELTGKLLAFARRQVLQPSAVDVGALLGSLADMLRRTLDQRVRIDVEAAADCPPVLADPGQLEAALLNIAINARDAMHDGGTLRFRARACTALPAEVRNGLDEPGASDDGFVAISVADTGSGMAQHVKERAFEPFFTTKDAGRGTGLGLSTVYGFVKQTKGAVAIDSTPGLGTTVTMYLPRHGYADARHDDSTGAALAVPQGLRVLLVEDDADVREVLRAFLHGLHCRVTQVASAEQALLALDAAEPFDLLLSDIALGPGMRGTRLAALAQQRFARMAVLLMSGYSAELINADRESPLGWQLLHKPCTRGELADAIARLMTARHSTA